MNKKMWIVIGALVVVAVIVYALVGFHNPSQPGSNTASGGAIKIVAAENFYGNIAQQLGGDKVSVTSILSDPNVDPHEYESDVQDGIAITNANIVIENGLEYDTWMDKLLSASPN